MTHAHLKCTLLLLLLVSLTVCNSACAPQRDGFYEPAATTATTTVLVNDFGETIYPCLIPNGYTYPKDTNPLYKEFSIWLSEDFVRPDLIWLDDGIAGDYISGFVPKSGTIYTVDTPIWDYVGTDSDRYAVILRVLDNYDLDKLITYLTDLGWESLSGEEPLFAATRSQIKALDCIDLQTYLGASTKYGIVLFSEYQSPHTHDPIEGDENCLWNCGSKLYQYLDEQAK